MVHYKKGDLFQAPEDLLAHGVNCIGAFGSGVAAGMAHNHRKARDYYFEKHSNDSWKLGEVQFLVSGNKWIANCATQFQCYPRNVCNADYPAIRTCMEGVKLFAQKNNLSIAIPKIGCGLAGGDWDTVKEILEDVFQDYDVTVYEL